MTVEGYPSRNSETGGLLRDQFVKTPRSSKWYTMHIDKKDSASVTVCDWSPERAKLNSTFTRVARRSRCRHIKKVGAGVPGTVSDV